MTINELADTLGVSVKAIYNRRNESPEGAFLLLLLLREGPPHGDDNKEGSLSFLG